MNLFCKEARVLCIKQQNVYHRLVFAFSFFYQGNLVLQQFPYQLSTGCKIYLLETYLQYTYGGSINNSNYGTDLSSMLNQVPSHEISIFLDFRNFPSKDFELRCIDLFIQVYTAQTTTIYFSTNCPHMHINYYNTTSYRGYYDTVRYGNGASYSFTLNFAIGMGQKLIMTDYQGQYWSSSCSFNVKLSLTFNCSIVKNQCYDCSSYTTCTQCNSWYYLYMNTCYPFPNNCLAMSGTYCTSCGTGFLPVSGVCRQCYIYLSNCTTCTSVSVCTACATGFVLSGSQCAACSSFSGMANCITCTSGTVCTSCPSGYFITSLTKCGQCTSFLLNCLTCTSPTVCTSCNSTGYALNAVASCLPCSTLISNCKFCSSNTTCTQCNVGYSKQPDGTCVPCNFVVAYCVDCGLLGECYDCEFGYGRDLNTVNTPCGSCSSGVSNCVDCNQIGSCTKCSDGFFVNSFTQNLVNSTTNATYTVQVYQCLSCASYLSNCAKCYNQYSCSVCNTNYALDGYSQCQSCSFFMTSCLTCSDRYTCTSCNSGSSLNASKRCQPCGTFMSQCINCINNSTCTTCASGFLVQAGACKFCGIYIPNCLICTNSATCTTCMMGYALNSIAKCKGCDFFIPNCEYCSSNSTCTSCAIGFIIYNGVCKTCGEVFPNCNTCVTNSTCLTCDAGFLLDAGICVSCTKYLGHCKQCYDKNVCEQCDFRYQVGSDFKCKCISPLYNVTDLCIEDKNCVVAYQQGDDVKCNFCAISRLFVLDSHRKCVCNLGFQEINSTCTEICGDGKIFKAECDDKNKKGGDGCSSICTIQDEYVCVKTTTGQSKCKLDKDILFKMDYTDKILSENKALIYLKLDSTNDNVKRYFKQMLFNYTLESNRSGTIEILDSYQGEEGELIVQIQYNQTIEDTFILLHFDYDEQTVISRDFFLHFQLKGNNYPLVISAFNEQYEKISKIQAYFIICSYGLVILMLLSDKFIAVEALNSFQMIFFSLLLIYKNENWPTAFSTILPLKYSTGFNQIFYEQKSFTNLSDLTFNKYRYIGMCEIFILNNFSNSMVLVVSWVIFLALYFYKINLKNELQRTENLKLQSKIEQKIERFSRIFRKFFNLAFNFSYIMIFQILVSLYIETAYMKQVSPSMKTLSKLTAFWTFNILIAAIMQNYHHFFLDQTDTIAENFRVGRVEARYKRVYFIYVLINAFCMVLFNNILFMGFSVSFLLLILSIIYFLFIICYRPYRYSYRVHGFTIIINQLIFVITLAFITAINFQVKIEESYLLIFCYTLMAFCFTVVFLTFIRVFLDCKYGSDQVRLEIDKERKEIQKYQQDMFMKVDFNKCENKGNQKLKKQKVLKGNKYVYQNQALQNEQIDYLNELKAKKFLSEWQRDQAYYRLYKQKPLKWVREYEKEAKFKYLLQKQKQQFELDVEKQKLLKRKEQKAADKPYMDELKQIKDKLREEAFKRNEKRRKKKQKKKQLMEKESAVNQPVEQQI